MRERFEALVIMFLITLVACGSKADANKTNFGTALDRYFETSGQLCLEDKNWPVISEVNNTKSAESQQMRALEAAGLTKAEQTEVDGSYVLSFQPRPVKATRFTLTEQAKDYAKNKRGNQVELCWGQIQLDEVVKWEGPMELGDYKEARVEYSYLVSDVAEWTKRPDIQTAFPVIKNTLEHIKNPAIGRRNMKLTSDGWEVIQNSFLEF